MTIMQPKDGFQALLQGASGILKALGFSKRGAAYRKCVNGNCGIVDFQSSRDNTADVHRFTINLAIVVGALLEPDDGPVTSIAVSEAHVRMRLGFLLPQHDDVWWEITNSTNIAMLTREVMEGVETVGVPYVERMLDTGAVCEIWKAGQSPGLTDGQRQRFLQRLIQ